MAEGQCTWNGFREDDNERYRPHNWESERHEHNKEHPPEVGFDLGMPKSKIFRSKLPEIGISYNLFGNGDGNSPKPIKGMGSGTAVGVETGDGDSIIISYPYSTRCHP
ncbi:Hypothetical predicted protein [Prunus dulcis]|uniref:Uncharacterized protein n=1 Tax=Prunus dulcis TaxID=3755 RepID=A0A5E4FW21_PRUDU|nr:Hypothetical predicted protein [Prunus dulcis]